MTKAAAPAKTTSSPTRERIRVKAKGEPIVATRDSFQNLTARLGIGAQNLASQSTYAINPITRNRMMLEYAYRGSWIVRAAVDMIADDMTREGLLFEKGLEPDAASQMRADISELNVMGAMGETIKWARLYGGACGYIMIDGADPSEPLRVDTIGKGQFRGIMPFDRWQMQTSLSDVITEPGPDLGRPKFYTVTSFWTTLQGQKIHHSRMLRFEGDPLPYWQKIAEMGWGASILEALFDRLQMFDSTSNGMAQLVYRAHLRVMSIDGLRNAIMQGSKAMEGVAAQLDWTRQMQSIEGLSIVDAKDKFEALTYSFSGLSDVLLQAAQQLSGALQIPLVRLFGQSPSGLNSSGESELRTYYDGIGSKQERHRAAFNKLARIIHFSSLGRAPAPEFDFKFAPLYELSATEKADIAVKVTSAVDTAVAGGLIDAPTAMQELRQSADVTGIFTNITDEAIELAKIEPPPAPVAEPPPGAELEADPGNGAPGARGAWGDVLRSLREVA